jgi:hypothetical protein
MATKTFRCLLCNPHKHFSSSEGYKHLDKVHRAKHELGVSHDYVDYPKPPEFRGQNTTKERHCVCLICNDNIVRGYSGTYCHVQNSHPGHKIKLGVTHKNVDLPTTTKNFYHKRISTTTQITETPLPYYELPCILRIERETGKRILILGG